MNAKSCPVGDAMCIRYEDYTAEDSRIPRPTPTPPSPRHTLPPGVREEHALRLGCLLALVTSVSLIPSRRVSS